MQLSQRHPLLRAVFFILAVLWFSSLTAQPKLLIDLRGVDSTRVDETGFILEKRYETQVGVVSITPVEDRGGVVGAVAKLRNHVIARAHVLSASYNQVEIEESQFTMQNSGAPVYVGRITFKSPRDHIASSTIVNGVPLYVVFVDWQWSTHD